VDTSTIKHWLTKYLPGIVAVPVGGFILWNLAFVAAALLINGIGMLFPHNFARSSPSFSAMMMIVFVALVFLLTWFIMRSALDDLYKAVYLTMPVAVVYVSIGVLLYRWPLTSYLVNAFLFSLIASYLFLRKRPWVYLYAVLFTTLTLLIFTLAGGEI
jgi:hypothetical protein